MYLYTSVIIQYERSQVQHGVSHALASEFGESFAQFARVLMVPSMYIIEALAYMTTLL